MDDAETAGVAGWADRTLAPAAAVQLGWQSVAGSLLRFTGTVPSASMTKTSAFPTRSLRNATNPPSGYHSW